MIHLLKKCDFPMLCEMLPGVHIPPIFGQTLGLRGSSPWPGLGWTGWTVGTNPPFTIPPTCIDPRIYHIFLRKTYRYIYIYTYIHTYILPHIHSIEDWLYRHFLWKGKGTTPRSQFFGPSEDVVLDFWARLLSPSVSTGQLRRNGVEPFDSDASVFGCTKCSFWSCHWFLLNSYPPFTVCFFLKLRLFRMFLTFFLVSKLRLLPMPSRWWTFHVSHMAIQTLRLIREWSSLSSDAMPDGL